MRVFAVISTMLLTATCALAQTQNVFAPWLEDKSPQIAETLSVDQREGVEITRLRFLSRVIPETGEKVLIYGVLARPLAPGKHPALLVCHGGSASADMVASQTEAWAQRGYVAFCQDEPGICDYTKTNSIGPWVRDGWSTFTPKIAGRIDTCSLFDGVVAALNGLALLRSRPEVDTSRVGVWGGSWGGYMTTMISGLAGDRLCAAFAVYGCGFYELASTWRASLDRMPEADRNLWLENLDAGRRAAGVRCPYFNCAASNDWFFWPEAVTKTLAQMPGYTNRVFSPNDSHVITVPGGTAGPPKVDSRRNRTHMETVWFAHHLDGTEKPFPKLTATDQVRATDTGIEVSWTAEAPVPFANVWAVYSPADVPARFRLWKPVTAEKVAENQYRAVVPVEDPDVPILWYGLATDERSVTVSTLIGTVDPRALAFNASHATPDLLAETFEGPFAKMRWRRPHLDRSTGRGVIESAAGRTGSKGLHLTGPARWEMNGVRGEMLRKSGAKGVTLYVRSANEKTVTGLKLVLVGEDEHGNRFEFVCSRTATIPLGPNWQQVNALWTDFTVKSTPPIEMLGPRVGVLRLDVPEGVDLFVDDLALIP